MTQATFGVIGGSGIYRLVDDPNDITIDTPYGPPSDAVAVGTLRGRPVAFIPRHGRTHHIPPHRINYRANLWALRSLGVRQVLAPAAVGSLQPELSAGTLVVPDQLVNRAHGREDSYFDGVVRSDGLTPNVVHLPFADPYCPEGRRAVVGAAESAEWPAVDGGTLLVINGPRFSTRAESRWHSAQGWSIVGMTGYPEAALARELGICYTTVALVTDVDAGQEGDISVTHDEVIEVFSKNADRLRTVVAEALTRLPEQRQCRCDDVLHGVDPGIQLGGHGD